MTQTQANPFKPSPWNSTLGKILELPVVGNHLLQTQVAQMSVQQLKELLDQPAANVLLIDVRYESEYKIAGLPGWVLVPYPDMQNGKGIAKIKQLLKDKRQGDPSNEPQVIVMCKAGVRSARAVALLKLAGITATNVTGGIHAWSQEIDPSIPQYSMKDISEHQLAVTKQQKNKKKQRWLVGGGVALAVSSVGAVLAVRHNPDLLVPAIKAGVPLEWAADYSSAVKFALIRSNMPHITAGELKQLVDSKAVPKDYLLVDVRTPEEYKISKIPGSVLVPLTEIEKGPGVEKIKSMLQGRKLIAYCTHGYRSRQALVKLHYAGISGTQFEGGIQEWTEQIDPSLPRNNF
jgi:adenylyltransferase/sulfurtransferase